MEAQLRGHRIFYERIGAGPPIVMVHGGPGLDHSYFRPFVDPLATDWELVFYDQVGNGRSERPPVLACGIEGWAAELDALCEHLGHARVVLLGHSFGALLAVVCALAYPERVAGLVLCSPGAIFGGARDAEQAASGREPIRPRSDEEFRARWLLTLPYYFHRYQPDVGERLDRAARYSAQANEHGRAAAQSFQLHAGEGRLRLPALVIGGASDWITPAAEGAAPLARAIPGAELLVLEASGHFPFIEEPERFHQAVRAFLHRIGHESGIGPDRR